MPPANAIILSLFLLYATAVSQLSVEKARISSPRTAVSSIQSGNKLYFAGGYENDDLIATDRIDIYNMDSKAWESPLKLSRARGFVSPATSGKYLYLVGGFSVDRCAKRYSEENHNYEWIPECGPTVRTAKQVSRHIDILTLLGAFSADFYDMTNNTWSHSDTLTSWMRSIVGGITFVHLDVVVGIGGVNRTTLEPFFGAWTFNITMNKLTIYDSVLDQSISNVGFKFNVAHNIVSVWTADRCFLHSFEDSEWYEERSSSIIRAVTLGHETFIVNASQLVIFDWTYKTSNTTTNTDRFIDVFTVNDQLVILEQNQLAIYDSVSWTYTWTPTFRLSAPFFHSHIFYNGRNFYTYNSTAKNIDLIQGLYESIVSIVAIDSTTFVAFQTSSRFIFENGIGRNPTPVDFTSFVGQIAIGRDIIDFSRSLIWVNMTSFVTIERITDVWTPDGMFSVPKPQQTYYPFIDVIDLSTGELISSLQYSYVGQFQGFCQLIIFNDTIAILPRAMNGFFYNFTSGNTTMVQKFVGEQLQPINSDPPVIDGVGYYMRGVSFFQQVTPNNSTSFATNQEDVGRLYQLFTDNTTIYFSLIANTDNLVHSIYIFDAVTHNDNSWRLFAIPEPQSSLFFAASNDMILLFGPNNTQLRYLYLPEPIEWKSVEFSYNYAPSAIRTLPDSTVLIAGGVHSVYGFYSAEVVFINATGLLALNSVAPNQRPTSEEPASGLTTGELAAAIVVPLVVVIAAGVILIVLLMKRNKRKKDNATTIVGLASKYGDWFVPFNQLVFEEQLGQGSSGQVFKGKWNNTVVALKVIMTQANSSVIGELELMMQMRPHPNVVQLFGFSVHPETQSIILIIEYCDGGSLQTVLEDNSVEISSSQQHEWMLGVAKGLNHLHSHNIVHRDIAARNVLLNRGEPKLTDFGMSRVIEVQNNHGTTKSELGPIRWMAPESLKSKQYSTKSDVWSFGILMFEIIARQEPHVTVDPIQVGLMIRDEGLTPVIPSDCPTKLAKLMRECWSVSPQSRPDIDYIVSALL